MRITKITTMRGFVESSAKKYRANGEVVTRKALESLSYAVLAKMIRQGKVESVT